MDIHTDYVEETMSRSAPDLKKYLNDKRCSNLTEKAYASEPHDERHEEYNKRGLRMQQVRTVENFQQSFALVDHYTEMKESCFEDYKIKMHGGNNITNQNYEGNIDKMRVSMRMKSYLTKPERKNSLISLEDEELNHNLPNIISIAQKQRQEDILNVIRHSDFDAGYETKSVFKVLKDDCEDKLGIDYAKQFRKLIASEENPELRENLREYYETSKEHPDFDEERIVNDILCHNYSVL